MRKARMRRTESNDEGVQKKRCTSVEMNLAERRSIIVAEGDDFQAKGSQSENFGNIQFFFFAR